MYITLINEKRNKGVAHTGNFLWIEVGGLGCAIEAVYPPVGIESERCQNSNDNPPPPPSFSRRHPPRRLFGCQDDDCDKNGQADNR